MDYGFFIGGMLGRVAGPIAQDIFEYNTSWGREIAEKKFEKQRRLTQMEYENKLRFSEDEHRRKLVEIKQQFEDKRSLAQEQFVRSFAEWQQKVFWEKCYPLRNPYEMPFGFTPKFNPESKELIGCELKTLSLPNDKTIVPLRIITAVKDSSHSHVQSVTGNLSMFLVNHFSANGEHAVLSDIGSWREDAPINDASINYLFKGLQGQPVMVLVPSYINDGSIVRIKIWSWGIMEQSQGIPLQYPIGFDFGWYNLNTVRRRIMVEEIIKYNETLKKISVDPTSVELKGDLNVIEQIEKHRQILEEEDVDRLLLNLKEPKELKELVNRRTNEFASAIFSCAAGMYADGYHLISYGTQPILPSVLPSIPTSKYFFPFIRDYYISLANYGLISRVLTPQQAIDMEFELGKSAQSIGCNSDMLTPLCKNLDFLLVKNKDEKEISSNYRSLVLKIEELRQTNNDKLLS